MSEWVSTKDSLPPFCTWVLVWDGQKQFIAERWIREGKEYFKSVICPCSESFHLGRDKEIIAWQPLPEPPKKLEKENE